MTYVSISHMHVYIGNIRIYARRCHIHIFGYTHVAYRRSVYMTDMYTWVGIICLYVTQLSAYGPHMYACRIRFQATYVTCT